MTERTRAARGPIYETSSQTTELLELAIEAHGGRARWREVTRITASLSAGGVLWASKGQSGSLDDATVTIEAHTQTCVLGRLAGQDRRGVVTPDRVAIETASGRVIGERRNPRASFRRPVDAPWDALHLAYFAGYALWNYLTVPFLLAQPGFLTEEFDPGDENGETRHGLRARFPSHIATHCTQQVFQFGPDGLLRRHDHTPELLVGDPGHLAVAHYTNEHKRYDGISFPTRRRAVALQPNGTPVPEPPLVTIEITDVIID
jgi:hypothetical protein